MLHDCSRQVERLVGSNNLEDFVSVRRTKHYDSVLEDCRFARFEVVFTSIAVVYGRDNRVDETVGLNINDVDALICGGIGGGAVNAIQEAGIKLYAGASGNTDAVVEALIAGTLDANGEANCDHHDHGHGEGHSCGHGSCH